MKKNIVVYILSIFIVCISCKKETTDNVSRIVNVSYPAINLKGAPADSIVFLPVGGTYNESGATLIDDITNAQSDILPQSNDLDINVPGVYYVTYNAHNANGFETVKTRVVVVFNPAIAEEDFTGTYTHTTGATANVTKLASRLFLCDDIYGTFTIPIPGYFVDYGDKLYIPGQPVDPSLGTEIHGEGEKSGTAGSFVLDFYGLTRDGNERPRTLTQQ